MAKRSKYHRWQFLLLWGVCLFCRPAGSAGAGEGTWRSLSREAARKGDYGRALEYWERLSPEGGDSDYDRSVKVVLLVNYAQALYRRNEYDRARDRLREALVLDPRNFKALMLRGRIEYYSQRLEEAAAFWEKGLAVRPGDRELAERLKQLKKELKVEPNLDRSGLANFDIRFHRGGEYVIYDIQGYLLEAYREIGYDFKYYPGGPLVVILYSGEEFARLRTSPRWVGGIYDGKIRLPVRTGELRGIDFKTILWHEYTHALIHDLTGNRCPTWLNEGLAQYEQAKVAPLDLEKLFAAADDEELIPLARLNQEFGFNRPPDRVRLAYLEAYSLTDYLIRKYGFWRVNSLLARLRKGDRWEKVLAEELFLTVNQLESAWQRTLE